MAVVRSVRPSPNLWTSMLTVSCTLSASLEDSDFRPSLVLEMRSVAGGVWPSRGPSDTTTSTASGLAKIMLPSLLLMRVASPAAPFLSLPCLEEGVLALSVLFRPSCSSWGDDDAQPIVKD